MAAYDLYGIQAETLDDARQLLERLLPVQFKQGSSDYKGGDYLFFGDSQGEGFTLKANVDLYDSGPAEDAFAAYSYLLYVDETTRAEELRNALVSGGGSIALLRHEDL